MDAIRQLIAHVDENASGHEAEELTCNAVEQLRNLEAQNRELLKALRIVEADATWSDEDTIESLSGRLDRLSDDATIVLSKYQEPKTEFRLRDAGKA